MEKGKALTPFDKTLLNAVQTDLPLESRPFLILAERLGSTEEHVIDRLRWLKDAGFIRRIGPFFDSGRLGYVSTLVAVEADSANLPEIAAAINAYPGVTHNYQREGSRFNLWFALLSPGREEQENALETIRALAGVQSLVSLPATQKFKVSVQFRLE